MTTIAFYDTKVYDRQYFERAADAVWALNSPQMRWLLLDHGWSDHEYARWLGDLIHASIFVSDPE